jgi:hypothetical protein
MEQLPSPTEKVLGLAVFAGTNEPKPFRNLQLRFELSQRTLSDPDVMKVSAVGTVALAFSNVRRN